MRHHNKNKKFGRVKNQRLALLRSLAVSLVRDGKIVTTESKAKGLRPFIEKLITRGRNGGVHALRLINTRLGGQKKAGIKLVNEIAPKYMERKGGYTRITKLAPKKSDGRKMAVIEFV